MPKAHRAEHSAHLEEVVYLPSGNYKIGEVDGSALEFRVGVSMSGDPVGLREIVELYDIHSAG